jgi:hypothetical protein
VVLAAAPAYADAAHAGLVPAVSVPAAAELLLLLPAGAGADGSAAGAGVAFEEVAARVALVEGGGGESGLSGKGC